MNIGSSASAAGGLMAQSGSNVLVTCRSSVRRGRTAASPSGELEVSTPSGRCDFRKAGGQVPRDSTSFAAPKLPFVTSRTRPVAVIGHPIRIAVIRARRYALRLRAARDGSPHYVVGCYFSCRVILQCTQFSLLNSHLQKMQSGIRMLCGKTVARKQSRRQSRPARFSLRTKS